jgi:flagellin
LRSYNETSSSLTASNTTGVQGINISGAQAGTFTFVDAAADGELTLGNGTISQTLDMGTVLNGNVVQPGTTAVANFDRIGVQVTLAGVGSQGATGDYVDGDLDGSQIVIDGGTGGIFQIGPSNSASNRLELGIAELSASGATLNLDTLSISSLATGRQALTGLDLAIEKVSSERGKLGAVQNRLTFSIAYNENEIENIQASEASIRDADIALEVTEFSRSQILLQSSNAMLVQANVGSVQALSLL